MKEIILCKYGEIVLKGLNRGTFVNELVKNVRRRLKPLGNFSLKSAQSTLYVEPLDDEIDMDEVFDRLKKVYGITKLSRAVGVEKNVESIFEAAFDRFGDILRVSKSFKVAAKRSDKSFYLTSPELAAQIGGMILERLPYLKVDLFEPDVTIVCEIRAEGAYIHGIAEDGAGGIPVGTSGQALLLLSGGIDSPVAGCMLAKRGVIVSAIHFEAPPYTSERALMKVEKLAEKMSEYCGRISFYTVPFTRIQEEIKNNCPEEYFTLIMRRLMMEIAQRVAEKNGIQALITGESLGQVASQTMAAMVTTDAVCRMPVFRPCIGLDKREIIDISYRLGTYEISIEPYEDCCTVFTPRHPKTKPALSDVEKAQAMFDFEPLIAEAVENTRVKNIKSY